MTTMPKKERQNRKHRPIGFFKFQAYQFLPPPPHQSQIQIHHAHSPHHPAHITHPNILASYKPRKGPKELYTGAPD